MLSSAAKYYSCALERWTFLRYFLSSYTPLGARCSMFYIWSLYTWLILSFLAYSHGFALWSRRLLVLGRYELVNTFDLLHWTAFDGISSPCMVSLYERTLFVWRVLERELFDGVYRYELWILWNRSVRKTPRQYKAFVKLIVLCACSRLPRQAAKRCKDFQDLVLVSSSYAFRWKYGVYFLRRSSNYIFRDLVIRQSQSVPFFHWTPWTVLVL